MCESAREKHALIVGGGYIGVMQAWYLRSKSYRVTVIEEKPQVAMETSYMVSHGHEVNQISPYTLNRMEDSCAPACLCLGLI